MAYVLFFLPKSKTSQRWMWSDAHHSSLQTNATSSFVKASVKNPKHIKFTARKCKRCIFFPHTFALIISWCLQLHSKIYYSQRLRLLIMFLSEDSAPNMTHFKHTLSEPHGLIRERETLVYYWIEREWRIVRMNTSNIHHQMLRLHIYFRPTESHWITRRLYRLMDTKWTREGQYVPVGGPRAGNERMYIHLA